MEAHAIQILNEPRQTLTWQIRQSVLIRVPTQEIAELLVKVRGGTVKFTELL